MKKTVVIASLAVFASAAVLATFALNGAGKFGDVQVNADPVEYSITFDANDTANTTVEIPNESYGQRDCAICRTTARGNKLGVAGRSYYYAPRDRLYFGKAANFGEPELHDDSNALINAGANDIKYITGYQIFFTGGSLFFKIGLDLETDGSPVTNGTKYEGLSITSSDDNPRFWRGEKQEALGVDVIISSLTIWYSC